MLNTTLSANHACSCYKVSSCPLGHVYICNLGIYNVFPVELLLILIMPLTVLPMTGCGRRFMHVNSDETECSRMVKKM
jgi:hypothetical protein